MDAKLKRKWVMALREGGYEQCKGVLHDGNGYCCLGVLHLVATGRTPPRLWGVAGPRGPSAMPKSIELSLSKLMRLADMNDTGHSFREIADFVSKNVRVTTDASVRRGTKHKAKRK